MHVLNLANLKGSSVRRFGSQHATHARIGDMESGSAVGVIHLAHEGRMGRHEATVPQLMVVLSGSGFASGEDEVDHPLAVGNVVLWNIGESHETWTETGMVLLILEADDPDLGVPR